MRVPYNWLKEYVDLELCPEDLADKLTQAGLEVDGLAKFGGELPGVVVARVLSIKPHPERPGLSLVRVDSKDSVREVVCGASNMKVGDLVALAKPGAQIKEGRLIKKAEVYGVMSEGMLCSGPELGLELGEKEGLLIFDEEAPLGSLVENLLELDEMILTLDLTPNRSDCLGLVNVALEVAALTNKKVKLPAANLKETDKEIYGAAAVEVLDEELCPRFTARVLEGVKVGPSPLWLQLRLLKAGVRPISNIVDITNFVMLEYNQPLHAYDLKLVEGQKIIVRRASMGEKLVTLDGVSRGLDPQMLVIADEKKPVGLAGVMGGEETEIGAETTEVLLEAAAFHPTNVRKTARSLALISEASLRFERGVNHETVLAAQNRAAFLISALAGGHVLKGAIDINHSRVVPAEIMVSAPKVNKVLGVEIVESEMTGIFKRLGFSVAEKAPGQFKVAVPLRRPDVKIEEDLIEEVARLHGYEKIPATLPKGALIENREPVSERLKYLIKNLVVSCGFFECISYSFINPSNLDLLGLDQDDRRRQAIEVQNPFSEEQKTMRTTVLPGLLKAVQHNLNHRQMNLQLFEIGAVFVPQSLPLKELPEERVKLAMVATGEAPGANWAAPSRKADFYTLKGVLELIFKRLQIENVEFVAKAEPFTHPTRSAEIFIDGKPLGYLGELSPAAQEKWDFSQKVIVAEIDFALLVAHAVLVPKVTSLPLYPAAIRDLALVVPAEISALELENTIKETGGQALKKVLLFDLYEGRQIPAGKKSLAYSLTFRSEEGTLKDSEVTEMMLKINEALKKLGAVLRD